MIDCQKYLSRYASVHAKTHHFTAHSHHPWLDATYEAQIEYWQDSNTLLDGKWAKIFSEVYPKSQRFIADLCSIHEADQIVFGLNTHEFLVRLLSCFNPRKKLKLLVSDCEFYSLSRQVQRMLQDELIDLTVVGVQPFHSFEDSLQQALVHKSYDMIYMSHVFFNSGFINSHLEILKAYQRKHDCMVVVDGYHAVGAMPVDMSSYPDFFYMGGGYKYLAAGEGAAFLVVPKNCSLEPVNTGWFADFSALDEGVQERVGYARNAMRFAGATFDPSALYRLNANADVWAKLGFTSEKIHRHVRSLQKSFLKLLEERTNSSICRDDLVGFDSHFDWANFLTFKVKDHQTKVAELKTKNILIDGRPGIVRFGFGYYHTTQDIEDLVAAL